MCTFWSSPHPDISCILRKILLDNGFARLRTLRTASTESIESPLPTAACVSTRHRFPISPKLDTHLRRHKNRQLTLPCLRGGVCASDEHHTASMLLPGTFMLTRARSHMCTVLRRRALTGHKCNAFAAGYACTHRP